MPASIAEALINEPTFATTHDIEVEASITFGASELVVPQSQYRAALRTLYASPSAAVALASLSGEEWKLSLEELPTGPRVVLSKAGKRLLLPDEFGLSPDRSRRLAGFERVVSEVSLPSDAVASWQTRLTVDALSDAELRELEADLASTPNRVVQDLRRKLASNGGTARSLVPSDLKYYQRLVGSYDGSDNILSYLEGSGGALLAALAEQASVKALLAGLVLCAHPAVSGTFDASCFPDSVIVHALEQVCESGSFVSKLGAVEVFLPLAPKMGVIVPQLLRLIDQLSEESPDPSVDRYQLLSSLIILVDGELSNTRVLSAFPPYWRRLAAITHASQLECEVVRANVDVQPLSQWIAETKAGVFELQTLCDLRAEPRWLPEMVGKSQLRAEFVGRMYSGALQNKATLPRKLKTRLLGTGKDSLKAKVSFPFAYFPGPVEGGIQSTVDPPADIVRQIERSLSGAELSPQSFAALVNSAAIFRVTHSQADMAASALKAAKSQLHSADDDDNLLAVLRGLATVAAATRSESLAAELRVLLRRYRNLKRPAISVHVALAIGLLGAAAHSELGEWADFAGGWLTELAFQDLTRDEARHLLDVIEVLCSIVPDLWRTVGRGHAALEAIT